MVAALVLVVVGACTSPATVSPTSTTPVATTTTTPVATTTGTGTSTTTGAATTVPPTSVTATTVAPTTVAPTTTVVCAATGTLADTTVNFPNGMSALVGTDIRTGAHPCFERVVIEFGSFDPAFPATAAFAPGYWVRYAERPILQSPIGEPVEVLGDAVLIVGVGSWMGDMEGHGYAGSHDIRPTNVSHIRQLLQIENYEGMTNWAIGLDRAYPYSAFTLDGPPRLVIDLFVS